MEGVTAHVWWESREETPAVKELNFRIETVLENKRLKEFVYRQFQSFHQQYIDINKNNNQYEFEVTKT